MTPPPIPAAAIAAARAAIAAHLRIAMNAEDATIDAMAASALSLGEAFTATSWIARDWSETIGVARAWRRLAMAPVAAITTVEGLPAEGAGFTLPAEAYAIDIDGDGEGWVRAIAPGAAGRIRVTYRAGVAAGWDDLPPPLAQGAVLLAAHLFEHREADALPPAAVAALWRPWRRMRLAGEVAR